MINLHTSFKNYLLILLIALFSIPAIAQSQNIVSYAYGNAGNRISRKIVPLNPPPAHAKKTVEVPPAPVEEQLGDRKIFVFPNPTKGALAVEITGGNDKDEIRIMLISAQGVQLQSMKVVTGSTPINMQSYPPGWFILRIQAGDKVTELKIIKQ